MPKRISHNQLSIGGIAKTPIGVAIVIRFKFKIWSKANAIIVKNVFGSISWVHIDKVELIIKGKENGIS